MPRANVDGTDIEYETVGKPGSESMLLIAGLGSQLLAWPDELCSSLAGRGLLVIRFDNRDVGLSSKFGGSGVPDFAEINAAYARGERPRVPYTLYDMAKDAVGVLDVMNIHKAHICGASMGGMIAQALACRYPSRVLSLTVIMSTTGNPALPPGKPEVMAQFFAPVPSDREGYVEEMVKRDRLIHGTYEYDEKVGRDYRTWEYDRCYYPEGSVRQLAALAVPGNIRPELPAIRAPTLVIHGKEDPFYPVAAAKDIASAIPGARLLVLDGMGHSLPRQVIHQIVKAILENVKRV